MRRDLPPRSGTDRRRDDSALRELWPLLEDREYAVSSGCHSFDCGSMTVTQEGAQDEQGHRSSGMKGPNFGPKLLRELLKSLAKRTIPEYPWSVLIRNRKLPGEEIELPPFPVSESTECISQQAKTYGPKHDSRYEPEWILPEDARTIEKGRSSSTDQSPADVGHAVQVAIVRP